MCAVDVGARAVAQAQSSTLATLQSTVESEVQSSMKLFQDSVQSQMKKLAEQVLSQGRSVEESQMLSVETSRTLKRQLDVSEPSVFTLSSCV